MPDSSYRMVVNLCLPAWRVCTNPVILGRNNVPKTGAAILAPTHLSHYDVPALMGDTPRNIDFMSVVEFLSVPFVGRLFTQVNCFFLDRSRNDPRAVRTALDRLRKGRLVSMFPEGRIRDFDDSIIHGKPFKPGLARLACMAGAPVVPCIVLDGEKFKKFTAWLPLMRTRYGVIYGKPIAPRADLSGADAIADLTARLAAACPALYAKLRAAMDAAAR